MKKKLSIFLFSVLAIFSCSKEASYLIEAPQSPELVKIASIPPITAPSVTINTLSENCGRADTLLPNFIYKGFGNVTPGEQDTALSFNLNPYTNASAFIKHNFIKGHRYTVTIPVYIEGYDDSGFFDVTRESYFPSIEISTLKSVTATEIHSCDIIPVSQTSDFKTSLSFPNGQDLPPKPQRTLTLTFVAESCFEFIGFKASSSVQKKTAVHIKKITIASESLISFEAEPIMCVGESQTVSFGISGYPINDNVEWYATGDLEIVGSEIGPSAVVKCVGQEGGMIGFKSCSGIEGGQEFAVRARSLDMQISGVSMVTNENTYSFGINTTDLQSITWEVRPLQYAHLVSGQGTGDIFVSFSGFYNSTNPRSVQIKATVTSKCGESKEIIKSVTLRGCRDCPIS